MSLSGKRILLGITGGIAAYKAGFLIRLLKKQGADVRCVLTPSAESFITPLTCQALSGNPVRSDLFDCADEHGMGHIELAKWADMVVIAPASANVIAKLAQGLADDLLTTLCLATPSPVVLAPAMNRQMWQHPATQANVETLLSRHVQMIGPVEGEQACGDEGVGCMASPETIVAQLPLSEASMTQLSCHQGIASSCSVVISAGPTQEAIDPVRYITNRSSGKMGFALADQFAQAGASVTLIAGPVGLPTPKGVTRVDVKTAHQMAEAVLSAVKTADLYIGAAAVADFTVEQAKAQKIKKTAHMQNLVLLPTVDIIQDLARRDLGLFLVGFAAETQQVEAYAKSKLKNKNLDMIIANQVGEDLGFDQDENQVSVYCKHGKEVVLGPLKKPVLSKHLVQIIMATYHEKTNVT